MSNLQVVISYLLYYRHHEFTKGYNIVVDVALEIKIKLSRKKNEMENDNIKYNNKICSPQIRRTSRHLNQTQ